MISELNGNQYVKYQRNNPVSIFGDQARKFRQEKRN